MNISNKIGIFIYQRCYLHLEQSSSSLVFLKLLTFSKKFKKYLSMASICSWFCILLILSTTWSKSLNFLKFTIKYSLLYSSNLAASLLNASALIFSVSLWVAFSFSKVYSKILIFLNTSNAISFSLVKSVTNSRTILTIY